MRMDMIWTLTMIGKFCSILELKGDHFNPLNTLSSKMAIWLLRSQTDQLILPFCLVE